MGSTWCCRRASDNVVPTQAAHAIHAERPARWLRRDATTGAQHVAGDGEFMAGGADIGAGVVQHQVLEVDELAIDPQRGAGVGEVHAFDPTLSNRWAGDALVETRKRRTCVRNRLQEDIERQFGKIVTHWLYNKWFAKQTLWNN
jgi:hypothetical protein